MRWILLTFRVVLLAKACWGYGDGLWQPAQLHTGQVLPDQPSVERLQQWTRERLQVSFVWASVKSLTQTPTMVCSLNWREIDLMVHRSVDSILCQRGAPSFWSFLVWAAGSRWSYLNHDLQASSATSKLLNLVFQHEYEQAFLAPQLLQVFFSEPNPLTPTKPVWITIS